MYLKTLLLFIMFTSLVKAQEVKESTFKKGKFKPYNSIILDDKLKETSGLIHWNGKLWTHNDDTDTNLYALDTLTGEILDTYHLDDVVNKDWEEIAQDESYLYIGDFGNNATGNRRDLHILKVEKESLLKRKPLIENINFSFEDQKDFETNKPNKTSFDCEAFVVVQDSIFLFTKQWKNKQTTIYKLPKQSGEFIAEKKASYKIKGLVTGASYFSSKKILVLCGYTRNGKPFVELFYDFKGNDFFSGTHKKIKIKYRFLQIEAITTKDGKNYYLTNEELKFGPIHKFQQMHKLDLSDFLKAD